MWVNFFSFLLSQIQAMSAPIEPIAVEIRGFGYDLKSIHKYLEPHAKTTTSKITDETP